MATYEFTVKITGHGDSKEEAWRVAQIAFGESTPPLDKTIKVKKVED